VEQILRRHEQALELKQRDREALAHTIAALLGR
jgi:hypothetical protein